MKQDSRKKKSPGKRGVEATGLATPWKDSPMIDAEPGGGRCPFRDCGAASKEIVFTKPVTPGPPSVRERVLYVKCRHCLRRYTIYEKPKQQSRQFVEKKA